MLVFFLPLIYLSYKVFIIYNEYGVKGLASHTDLIHDFILIELFLITIYFIYKNVDLLKQILFKYIDIAIVFIIIFGLKIYMLNISDIELNIIYLFQIIAMSFIELIPIYLFRILLLRYKIKTTLFLYVVILNLILLLNIGIYYYYYYTFSIIEPIIFSNINLESINGFFIDFSNITIAFIFSIPIIYNILLYIMVKHIQEKYIISKKDTVAFISIFIILFLSFKTLFYADKYSARKVLDLYNAIRTHQDIQVNKITTNSFYAYFYAFYKFKFPNLHKKDISNTKLTQNDMNILNKLGIKYNNDKTTSKFMKKYNKIIIITFESLSIDFIHYYNNNKIPEDVTPYLDTLLKNNFHLNNFYTSNMPTDYGMTAILKSKLDLNTQSKSIFDYMDDNGYKSYLINGVSQYYGIMGEYYPKAFRPYSWIYKEKLEKEYGNQFSGWGFHNNILYNKALKLLKQDKSNKVFMVIKTIDFHQPGTYVPKYIKNKYPNEDHIIQTLRWIDSQLKDFINEINIDDKTLILITADHNPHNGVDFTKYAIKGNNLRLAKIPLIFVTKYNDFKTFNNIENNLYEQVDIMPTLLSTLGIKFNQNSLFGRNIFSKNKKNYYLGKYQDNLFYKSKNKNFKCNLIEKEDKICEALKNYYFITENKNEK